MPIGELVAKLYDLKRDKGSGWEKPILLFSNLLL
jgi:hypothetical protein